MFEFSVFSGYTGAVAFGLLSALLLAADQGHRIGRLLIGACLVSTFWFALSGAYYAGQLAGLEITALEFLELLRNLFWFGFLTVVLRRSPDERFKQRLVLLFGFSAAVVISAAILTLLPAVLPDAQFDPASIRKTAIFCHLLIAILALVFVEQLIRVTRADELWAVKHLCLGIGAVFAYDFYLYADALLFTRINPDLWAARGAVNAIAVPLIALAAARNRNWDLNIFVSRRVVFHSTAALAAGFYLLLMSAAGYYLNSYGGSWGAALRTAFLFGALLFLITLIISSQVRSRLRMYLAKHFYKNRYEYGEVWLSFTRTLSSTDTDPDQLRDTILRAIVDIVDSTGGIMWTRLDDGNFAIIAQWSMVGDPSWILSSDDEFIRMLEASQDVVELRNEDVEPNSIQALTPVWLKNLRRAWTVVPILHGDELLAFLVLAESRTNASITWEDRDLLRTIGRQAASYLAFLRATEALAEARQFEAFNRLSAFLVHDLKNVVAQLSLVVSNADRHRDNPEFITDAFNTIGDATAKINRMLSSLRHDNLDSELSNADVDLSRLIEDAIAGCRDALPMPKFEPCGSPVTVRAAHDRFLSVFEHLIQNAQEATDDRGEVRIELTRSDNTAIVKIVDTGCGMDEEFIRTRLFRPFDTTKGKAGMGIGVYESRHVISSIGGRLDIESEPGRGTSIKISLPCTSTKVLKPNMSDVQSSPA